jgi:hypothetical protein
LVIPWGSRSAPRIVLGTDDPLAVAAFQDAAMVFYYRDDQAFIVSVEQVGVPDPEDYGQLHVFAGDSAGNFLSQYLDCDYDVTNTASRMQLGGQVDVLHIGAGGVTSRDVNIHSNVSIDDELHIDIDTWHDMTLLNGWTDRAGHTPLQYRHTPSSDHVTLVGQIVPGTLVDGTTVATLPVGYRPSKEILIPARKGASAMCSLNVATNGNIQIFDAAGAALVQLYPTAFPLDPL